MSRYGPRTSEPCRVMSAVAARLRAVEATIKRAADDGQMTAWMWMQVHQIPPVCDHLVPGGYALVVHPDANQEHAWLEIDFSGRSPAPVASYD